MDLKKYQAIMQGRSGGEDDTELWMAPYGNLMILLMIFFLAMYGIAQFGSEKSKFKFEKTLAAVGQEKESELAEKLETYFGATGKVEINAQKIKVSLPAPVLFDSGKTELKEEAKSSLLEIAQLIKNMPNKVIVDGHSDNQPIGSGVKYSSNWELSAARAFSVIKFLIDQELDPKQFSAYGYGEYRPLYPNDTEEHRTLNRRIEINIIREQEKQEKK